MRENEFATYRPIIPDKWTVGQAVGLTLVDDPVDGTEILAQGAPVCGGDCDQVTQKSTLDEMRTAPWSAPAERSDDGAFGVEPARVVTLAWYSRAGSRFACPRTPRSAFKPVAASYTTAVRI